MSVFTYLEEPKSICKVVHEGTFQQTSLKNAANFGGSILKSHGFLRLITLKIITSSLRFRKMKLHTHRKFQYHGIFKLVRYFFGSKFRILQASIAYHLPLINGQVLLHSWLAAVCKPKTRRLN